MKYLIFIFLFFGCTTVKQKEIRTDAIVETKGMSCPMCANNIDRVLKKNPDIDEVHINLKKGLVIVQFKSGQKPPLSVLILAVEDSGFTVENAEYSK